MWRHMRSQPRGSVAPYMLETSQVKQLGVQFAAMPVGTMPHGVRPKSRYSHRKQTA